MQGQENIPEKVFISVKGCRVRPRQSTRALDSAAVGGGETASEAEGGLWGASLSSRRPVKCVGNGSQEGNNHGAAIPRNPPLLHTICGFPVGSATHPD